MISQEEKMCKYVIHSIATGEIDKINKTMKDELLNLMSNFDIDGLKASKITEDDIYNAMNQNIVEKMHLVMCKTIQESIRHDDLETIKYIILSGYCMNEHVRFREIFEKTETITLSDLLIRCCSIETLRELSKFCNWTIELKPEPTDIK